MLGNGWVIDVDSWVIKEAHLAMHYSRVAYPSSRSVNWRCLALSYGVRNPYQDRRRPIGIVAMEDFLHF